MSERKYPDDFINKIICGDCLEVMKEIPKESIDLIVTDPPYGLNVNNGDLIMRWERVFGGDVSKEEPRPVIGDSEEESMRLLEGMLKEAKRILKKGANCCCCCSGGGIRPVFAKWALLMDNIIGFKQAVVWDKGSIGMGIHYRRSYEFILIGQKRGSPAHRWNGGNNTSNVWHIPKIIPKKDQHPTIKPVELFEKMINIHSNENDVVLDPFIGTGASVVACKRLNRKFIGIEISQEYCKIAESRLRAVPGRLERWM